MKFSNIIIWLMCIVGSTALGTGLTGLDGDKSLSFLFWNLRTFGVHRASDEHGIELNKITSNYDILLFAEIKDAECSGIHCPMKSFFQKYLPEHQIYLSPPLHYCDHQNKGSEQYGILVKNLQYEPVHFEDKECLFIRPPHGVRIRYKDSTLVVLLFHSHPGSEQEIIALDSVFEYFGQENILLLGDLNTGCRYTKFEKLDRYPIGNNYTWILDRNQFTNFEKTCPYDRIVSTNDLKQRLFDAKVLNQCQEAERIGSDHYPISISVN